MKPEQQYIHTLMMRDVIAGALTVLCLAVVTINWVAGKIKKHFKETSNG